MATTLKKRIDFPLSLILLILGLFVFIPMLSAFEFSIRTPLKGGYGITQYVLVTSSDKFTYYILRSSSLALGTVVLTLLVLVPTLTWLHLSQSKIRPLVDALTLFPLIIPVVAYAVGVQNSLPEFVRSSIFELPCLYFILSLPYAYRALDIGLNAIPLKVLTEAAQTLGASRFRTIVAIIAPVIQSSVLATTALTFALSIGEYTLTVLLHWDTFPTWITFVAQENILGAIAISMISLIVPFFLLTLISLTIPDRSTRR